MKYEEVRFVEPNCKTVRYEDQMLEAVKAITNRLVNYKPLRGYSQRPESFGIRCDYDSEKNVLRVIGTIEHTQRGLTPEERIEVMTEALMDWDKASGRR